MAYTVTSATKKIASMKARIRGIQGGSSAGKTIASLLYLIARAQTDEIPTLTSVVAESLPHIKRGAMRDFLNIMREHGYYVDDRWNRSDFTYEFETGSKIEFFGVEQPEKVKGARRDRLFGNESNNIPYETFSQLEIRTKEFVMLDWNPSEEFWFYTEILGKRTDVEHIILTYKDNEGLDERIVQALEQRKVNKSWWRVYGEGQLGEIEGRIYTGWRVIDDVPFEARLERYGLDFGYTNDPTAIVAIYKYDGGFILDEVCYEKGLSNKQIADLLKNLERSLIVADSAEPKSIDELKLYGCSVIPAKKGRDSVRTGIQLVQAQKISVTQRSVNLLREYKKYMWKFGKDGRPISPNVPEHSDDHILDATRYGLETIATTLADDYEEDWGLYASTYR